MKRITIPRSIILAVIIIILGSFSVAVFAEKPTGTIKYTIRQGDTLHLLSLRFGTSVEDISSVNKSLNLDNLLIGRKITIPIGKDIIIHQIKKGDVLWKIAERYDSTIDTVVVQNHINNPDLIYSGDILAIPKGKKVVWLGGTWLAYPEQWKPYYDGAYALYSSKSHAELDKMIKEGQAFLAQIRQRLIGDEGEEIILGLGDSSLMQEEKGEWSVRIYFNSMAMGVPHHSLGFRGTIFYNNQGLTTRAPVYTNGVPVDVDKFVKAFYAYELEQVTIAYATH